MSQRLQISISDNLFIWLKAKAATDLRSVNNFINILIADAKKKDEKEKKFQKK